MNNFTVGSINVRAIIIALSFLISSTNIYAQHSKIIFSNGERTSYDKPKNVVGSAYIKDGKVQLMHKEDIDEEVRLIVTFKDQPLSIYQAKKSSLQKISLSSLYASLQIKHTSFKTSLNTIKQQLSFQLKSDYSYTIVRDYYRALNGVALQCKRGMIEKIRALPMVKYISLDGEVKADLKESVHQIRADIVQDSLGYKGKGVLVGDVDTGIDYDNPALGGGFGPGFRVIGGYDFANNDNDPMDDHGHGTHVAGIIGANGGDTLRGVAPEVKFLAVKVLNANGEGEISNVIAGIEYCLDPDGNPATDDAVDIINMSLGGDATIDNPLDSAVNNATKAGVLSVIAAGNSGALGYGTISSPGTSESALTVGACDSASQIASFSSEGPDPLHSAIKPEVVAPGVHILSTILHNQTASWSGTSMATPHVTGLAALLKQEHLEWTPEEIKAAIVNSAHSVGDTVSPFLQGTGCVDALDAATIGTVVVPGVMNFGWVDLTPNVWVDTLQLKVKNFRNVSQNVQVHTLEGVPSGATLSFNKTSFSLAPMEETTIAAVLTVPSSVPVLTKEPFAYLGKIEFASDSDNIIVPFSFFKVTTLAVTFDIPPGGQISVVDLKSGSIRSIPANGGTKYILPLTSEDPIDILALMNQLDTLGMGNCYFVDHKIDNPVGLTYAFVSHKEATISMSDSTIYDVHNNNINIDTTVFDIEMDMTLSDNIHWLHWFLGFAHSYNPLFFSQLDSSFFVYKATAVSHGTDVYGLKKYHYGIKSQQDIDLPSGPNNLVGFNFTSDYHNPVISNISDYVKEFYVNFNFLDLSFGDYYGIDFLLSKGKLYLNKQDIKNNPTLYTSTALSVCYDVLHTVPGLPMLCTPEFTIDDNNEAVFENVNLSVTHYQSTYRQKLSTEFVVEVVQPGDTINVEDNLHVNFPNFVTYLEGDSLYLTKHYDIIFHNDFNVFRDGDGGTISSDGLNEQAFIESPYWNLPRFKVQTFAHNRSQVNVKPYKLFDYKQSWTPDDYQYAYDVFMDVKKNAGLYRILSDTYPYKLLGQSGQCTVDYEYQMPDPAKWPPNSSLLPLVSNRILFPSFSLLQVSVNDRAVNIVRPDQNGKIRLVLFDLDSSVTSVKLSLVLASGDEIVVPASYCGGHEYDASIPTYIPKGFIDIVARAKDTKGNACELIASPAFYFGSTTDSVRLDARVRMTSYALNNVDKINFYTGDTLKYTLSYINYGNNAARKVLVTFPTTPYFKPVGSQSWTIDSLGMNDTVHIPINIVFQGKQQSIDEQIYYSPSITWTSGGTTYLRKHKVLVDFQNTITSVAQTEKMIPNKFELYQNYPNPFNPSSTISYSLPEEAKVKIDIFNILGQNVATVVDRTETAGNYKVIWNAGNLSSGVYFCKFKAEGKKTFEKTQKLVLMK
ncbi:MAG: S8 family serine peptidase [Bacteroidota bacterium]|jgi:hypothetical protein